MINKQEQKAQEELKRNIVEYRAFLESCDFIKANTQWGEVQDRLENDERCSRLDKTDWLEIFQEYISDLEEEEVQTIQKEELRQKERKNRDEFRRLLEDHKATGVLTAKTHWPDYCAKVKNHPAYLAVASNTSGSPPKDLFEDVAEGMKKQYQEDKLNIKDAMESGKLAVTSAWTLDKFKASIGELYDLDAVSETNLKLLFEEVIEQVKEKEEKEAKRRERLADDFTDLLYSLKEIVASSKWEDCIPLLKDAEAYRAISDESFCREIFDEYIANLHEKVKENKHKRDEEKSKQNLPQSSRTTQNKEQIYTDTIKRSQHALDELERTLHSDTIIPNREKATLIRDELIHMIDIAQSYNPYDDISIDAFYASLSHSVTGVTKWKTIDNDVSSANVKSMFPYYQGKQKIRGYRVTRCTDVVVAPFIYPRWLAAHHMWPQKDELPLYFCKQLFAEFHLHYDVDYTDFPSHAGQGKGRFSDRFRRDDAPEPANKRVLVGPNLLVLPKRLKLSNVEISATDERRKDMFTSIATIATQVDQMSYDCTEKYMSCSHTTTPPVDHTSPHFDSYIRANIPSPIEIARLPEDRLRDMGTCLSSALLDAYQCIEIQLGVPLHEVSTHIKRVLHRPSTPSSHNKVRDPLGTLRQEDIFPHPTVVQQTTVDQDTPSLGQTSFGPTVQPPRVHGAYSNRLMNMGIDPDVVSLHSSDSSIVKKGRNVANTGIKMGAIYGDLEPPGDPIYTQVPQAGHGLGSGHGLD